MSEPSLHLATTPVTWGVEVAGAPSDPPCAHLLDEVAQSGIDALERGPVGCLPEDAPRLREALSSRDLIAVGSYVVEDRHDARMRRGCSPRSRRRPRQRSRTHGTHRGIGVPPHRIRP
jgi:hypothetical protein